ncbi:type VII toxin-antitoxin system HepT family RNase toxin [Fuchsiella alkaliacetigena]|uniref:type VII toxin-antitoxin system HepT family RNase toxin n=1 Tax=Fuchsiella alkaliacetigena TaxID=957042 RepID=UPI00200B4CEE|nr:DUF86 domain-containing protein [Fuchsiella alkaliacetigena]MCK8824294.1 DUF86 domain-containing protein [Fuchsiella alkaliacetigena]
MVNQEIIQKRIDKANQYLDFLNEIRADYSLREFKSDPLLYGSSERFLHLCIESFLDIGNHIISDQNLGKVDAYSDIPKILFENDYLSAEIRDVFIMIVGFRNILVHDYLEIDREIVYSVLEDNLEDLKRLVKVFAEFL